MQRMALSSGNTGRSPFGNRTTSENSKNETDSCLNGASSQED